MHRKFVTLSIFVLLLAPAVLQAADTDVNELEFASVFYESDAVTYQENGSNDGAFCTGNPVLGGARPVMWYWPLFTSRDQVVISDVNILSFAAYGSEGNVSWRICLAPKPWDELTVNWANYVGNVVWQDFFNVTYPIGFLTRSPLGAPGWSNTPAYFKGTIPRTVLQNWLDHPGANYGLAMVHRPGYAYNACMTTRSGQWWGQGLGPHILFTVRYVEDKAKAGNPLSGSINVPPFDLVLSWSVGDYAASHDVYFGTDFNDVNTATRTSDPNNVRKAVGQTETWYPAVGNMDLAYGTTYYWRIDEVNQTTGVPFKGTVWYFTTTNGKATMPNPAVGQTGIVAPVLLSWTRGTYAADTSGHDVYLGTDQTAVTNATVSVPLGVYKARVTDPNYLVTTLNPGMTYYWRIDEVNTLGPEPNLWKGDVWNFATLGSGKAMDPSPADGSTIQNLATIVLSWRKGDWVRDINEHEVYFGTTLNEVNDANRTVHPNVTYAIRDVNNYDPRPLEFSRTYYWRVDEINDINDPSKFWKGDVWSFIVPDYIVVENFDAYGNDAELYVNWNPYDYNYPACSPYGTGSWLVDSADDMRYTYDNNGTLAGNDYYSEAHRDFGASGVDWTTGSPTQTPKAFALSFAGVSTNSANPVYDRMYVGVEDTNGNLVLISHPDPNAIKNPAWQQWNIPLTDISGAGVNLKYVRYLVIGFGVQCNWTTADGGEGRVDFDDIRLYPSRCVVEYGPAVDLTGDCIVNFADLDIVTGAWLNTDSNIVVSPIQQPADPCLWYKFDDGTGTVADDFANNYNGTLKVNNGWNASGGFDGGGYLYFNGLGSPEGQNVSIPTEVLSDNIGEDMTISVWIKVNANDFPQSQNWVPFLNAPALAGEEITGFTVWCPTPFPPLFPPGPSVHYRFNGPDANVMDDDDLAECYPPNVTASSFTGSWHHYAFVKKGSTDFIAIYHNGQLLCDPSGFADSNVGTIIASAITMGASGTWTGGWAGGVDDFRIFDYALSAAEVGYIATNGTGELPLPLDTPADLHKSTPNIVDFKDFSVLAEDWMAQQYWP